MAIAGGGETPPRQPAGRRRYVATGLPCPQPRSGARIEPTAQAVGTVRPMHSPEGAKETPPRSQIYLSVFAKKGTHGLSRS